MTVVLETGTVIDESHNAVFFTPYQKDRNVLHGTIHWWGDTQDFDVVIATFCNGGKQTSAHYIVEEGRVACVVNPDDIAWACGNWTGNLTSISIECNPRQSDGDYREVAALIKYLRSQYGDFDLVPHRHWVATECPGTYDLNRIESLSRQDLTITEDEMALTPEQDHKLNFLFESVLNGGNDTPHKKSILELLGAVYDHDFNGGSSMPDNKPFKDYVKSRLDKIDETLKAITDKLGK